MKPVGFLVNPIAGMGGKVGLKGTDNLVREAASLGASPIAPERAVLAISPLRGTGLHFFTCSNGMGEDILHQAGIGDFEVIYRYEGESTAEDTRNACRAFIGAGAGLIVFCGGDGTARDVFDAVGRLVPIIGIPAGVKMFSAVFSVNPAAAAGIIQRYEDLPIRDSEVLDVDEGAYRTGEFRTSLYGYARVPMLQDVVQAGKRVYEEADEERAKDEIARFIVEVMSDGGLYILGPGTTTARIAERIGIKKTLLGFDAVRSGKLVQSDLNEEAMLRLAARYKHVTVVLSVIGAQGFVLGRGTQSVSPRVIERVGHENIVFVATPHKLSMLPLLFIDTGDPALDRRFGITLRVITGYRIAQRKRIGARQGVQ
ncbi:MAG: ATP-NAD kinase family protein [Methanoregulaceae archaeon]|nr:ATP-NAD kinase family protein [Methanoregulaceae archaeon]